MSLNENKKKLLRNIPKIDKIVLNLKNNYNTKDIPETLMTQASREITEKIRKKITSDSYKHQPPDLKEITNQVFSLIKIKNRPNFKKVINATGVIVHTNLGRSLLAKEAADFVYERATGFSNLELDLATGKRGLRYSLVENLICEISGCESAMAVNNNAAAVLLCLDTFAKGKEVIVSRGELVEIGGSFRIPEVMEKSGALLKEVGTTNRTHLKDYEKACNDEKTAVLMKVHTSNFNITGFTASVSLDELHKLSRKKGVILMEDLGSGTFTDLSLFGLPKEPTVQESVKAGADIVTFSGDKLLGGPQAGIIAGKKELIEKIRQNPLTRALRIDKMTLAALEMTLRLYREPEKAVKKIPTLRMLSASPNELQQQADILKNIILESKFEKLNVSVIKNSSRAGGGSLPETEIPTFCVGVKIENISSIQIEKFMRKNSPPVMGRIENNIFVLDPRTIQEDEYEIIGKAFKNLKEKLG